MSNMQQRYSYKFNIGDLNLKYIYDPTECDTCRPDYIIIKCKNIGNKSHALFKTICDIAQVNVVIFYENYRTITDYVGIEDSFYFYLNEFEFVMTWNSRSWAMFYQYEYDNKIDELIELIQTKFYENIDFHINEDELLTRPVAMMKSINNNHVVIKETTELTSLSLHKQIKTAYILKTEEPPYIEYDLIDGFDIYEEWPFRAPLPDLIMNEISQEVDDFSQPFKISFYKFAYPSVGYGGLCNFIDVYQKINNGMLSIDMVYDINQDNVLLVKIGRIELYDLINSLDYSDIRYNSNHANIFSKDKIKFKTLITDALRPYVVTDYEVAPYDQQQFERDSREFDVYNDFAM